MTDPAPVAAAALFVHQLSAGELPAEVVHQARRCLLDTLGVAAAGSRTTMSALARGHAVAAFGSGQEGPRLLFDGARTSPVGAAMAGAATIDSFDAHDGHVLTKGHVGVAVVPAALAFADRGPTPSGAELLTAVVLGYELGTRAGIALHRTSPDYHTSGAWNAVACAAIGARALRLDGPATEHAFGIAEYHGPRSPMMRCIDDPTMVKDGSMWGAAAGVSAALLAGTGFTGAPASTTIDPAVADLWADLGERWYCLEQYVKPHAVCRWAQPAVEAALVLRAEHRLVADDVAEVEVTTFAEATRLATREPSTTEQAQYSLPFSVATALVHGRLSTDTLLDPSSCDQHVRRLSVSMTLVADPGLSARFPAERHAWLRLRTRDGTEFVSALTAARGGPDDPLSDADLVEKFLGLTVPVLGEARSRRILAATFGSQDEIRVDELLHHVLRAPTDPDPGA